MDPAEIIEKFKELQNFLLQCEGKTVKIVESISINNSRGYDRHVTIQNIFIMEVKRTGWQISGGHIYLYGEKSQYGIFSQTLNTLEISPGQMVAIDQFETKTERKSVIRIIRD